MTSTMDVSNSTKDRLKILKSYWSKEGVSTLGDVVKRLLDERENRFAAPIHKKQEMDMDRVEGGVKNWKQFFSYKDMEGQYEVLKYWTGLKPAAVDWLWKELGKLVRNVLFFLSFCSCALLVQYSWVILS